MKIPTYINICTKKIVGRIKIFQLSTYKNNEEHPLEGKREIDIYYLSEILICTFSLK